MQEKWILQFNFGILVALDHIIGTSLESTYPIILGINQPTQGQTSGSINESTITESCKLKI